MTLRAIFPGLILAALIGLPTPVFAIPLSVDGAAKKFVPDVEWRATSQLSGDFTCRGRVEYAILGAKGDGLVVAIFRNGLSARPDVLRYRGGFRDASTAVLAVEDLDFEPKQMEREVGMVPEGLRPSKTCMGLNLSDGKVDSAHIYWNRKAKRFDNWSY